MGNAPRADIIYGLASQGDELSATLLPVNSDGERLYDVYDFGAAGWPAEYLRRTGQDAKPLCKIGTHGFSEDPGEFVGIASSHLTGDWDSVTVLKPEHFKTNPEWDAKLEAFCEVMDIKWSQPQWILLCSDD